MQKCVDSEACGLLLSKISLYWRCLLAFFSSPLKLSRRVLWKWPASEMAWSPASQHGEGPGLGRKMVGPFGNLGIGAKFNHQEMQCLEIRWETCGRAVVGEKLNESGWKGREDRTYSDFESLTQRSGSRAGGKQYKLGRYLNGFLYHFLLSTIHLWLPYLVSKSSFFFFYCVAIYHHHYY